MKKLIGFSVDPYDTEKFDNSAEKMQCFLNQTGLHGCEVFLYSDWDRGMIPKNNIIGAHARFWPIWLDFWKENQNALIQQFDTQDVVDSFYECKNKEEFIKNYRKEMIRAAKVGVEYVVFHVSHVTLEHIYNGNYTYNDLEVALAFIDFLNQVFEGVDAKFNILLENHWYPGLTMLDKSIMQLLLDRIRYPKLGFVLDIGHLMNTNPELIDETEAVEYMIHTIEALGNLKSYIKAIHMNGSLTGEYQKWLHQSNKYDPKLPFMQRFCETYEHIAKLDRHIPFVNPEIQRLIQIIQPDFLVYEFSTASKEELEQFVKLQNEVLGCYPEINQTTKWSDEVHERIDKV